MTTLRPNGRLQVGSAPWVLEEKTAALQMADSEVEEFSFSAKNELDWLNEHMAQIFDENQLNVTELFKTPGKLRGKTPRMTRKQNPLETRAPLSDIFSATPLGAAPNIFRQPQYERQVLKFSVAEDAEAPAKQEMPPPEHTFPRVANSDSGYHGSQASTATDAIECSPQPQTSISIKSPARAQQLANGPRLSEDRRTTEGSFQSAQEVQSIAANVDIKNVEISQHKALQLASIASKILSPTRGCHGKTLETTMSPEKPLPPRQEQAQGQENKEPAVDIKQSFEDIQSPSESSSPIRPIRHSSLSFATLPPREPLTNAKKSFGNRTSRTSHLDRTSYYERNAGGRSLGGQQLQMDQDDDEVNTDGDTPGLSAHDSDGESKTTHMHSKTSTQRLQDQISMLGKTQTNVPRPSKSIPNMITAVAQKETMHEPPIRTEGKLSAPGAFPEDDDDWIGPPHPSAAATSIFSPRPELTKSHTLAVMNGLHEEIDESVFNIAKQRSPMHFVPARPESPLTLKKYASASVVPSPNKVNEASDIYMKKGISVSNPDLASASERGGKSASWSPFKSPMRSGRDSPLKAAKDKISSILKTSRGLFASSAAVSAEGHSSTLPAPSSRPSHQATQDTLQDQPVKDEPLYPLLDTETMQAPISPSRHGPARRTRASTEREEKIKEKQAKEARMMNEQLEKLEKLREKESQKARVFSQEQERLANMKKQLAAQKDQEEAAKVAMIQSPKATRSSPRKTKAQLEAERRDAAASSIENADRNIEMTDASKEMPPPSNLRPVSQLSKANKEHPKRITKPTIAPPTRGPKATPAPVHIKVHTGVHGGAHRNPLHPSNSALASSLGDSLAPVASRPGPSLTHKASMSSIKSSQSASSTRRPAALTAAARAKEQHEREAQRRRDLTIENQRKRAALEEERRQEQQRLEAEKAKERQRAQAEASKNAQRQILERAKAERPPPPAARPLTANNSGYASNQDKPLPPAPSHRVEPSMPRPQRMNSTMHRPLDDTDRAGIVAVPNMAKAPPKRPFPQDSNEESSRPILQRNGPSHTDKRRKTEEQSGDAADIQPRPTMAPPVRQSAVRPPKDGPSKSIFANGYANVPQSSHGAPTLLQQATRPQQGHQQKPAHPMDMAHNSKAPINFAPNPAQASGPHKTPARPAAVPGGKSTVKASAKSSPRYQNGDSIDLPEINTDSEDSDSDAGGNDFSVPDWANSPNLVSGLVAQEGLDPVSVFGRPSELKMEEVFRNKERWGRFRQRTSSANWSGSDRLTDEEVRKDLEAREKLRREGGWSYGLS